MRQPVNFTFTLYVAGEAQNSVQARVNLDSFCRKYLAARHEIEVVNVVLQPKRALADGVCMTPTVVRLIPTPMKRIVGTLSQTEILFQALGLKEIAP